MKNKAFGARVDLNEPKYTLREAAPILGKAEKTLRTWVATGKIGHLQIGRNIFIPQSELQRVLDEAFVPARDADVEDCRLEYCDRCGGCPVSNWQDHYQRTGHQRPAEAN